MYDASANYPVSEQVLEHIVAATEKSDIIASFPLYSQSSSFFFFVVDILFSST